MSHQNYPFVNGRYVVYEPTEEDKASPAYKLITGEADKNLIDLYKQSPELVMNNMSEGLKTARRKAVMANLGADSSNPPTTTEILLSYRGTDELEEDEQMAFQKTIVTALRQESAEGNLTAIQKARIVKRLADTIASDSEVEWALTVAKEITAEKMLLELIQNRYEESYQPPALDKSFTGNLLRTRAELYPRLTKPSSTSSVASEVSALSDVSEISR